MWAYTGVYALWCTYMVIYTCVFIKCIYAWRICGCVYFCSSPSCFTHASTTMVIVHLRRPPMNYATPFSLHRQGMYPSRGSLLHRDFSVSSTSRRWWSWFPPSSAWVSLTLYFYMYLCAWLYMYVCKFVCVCLWLRVVVVSDSFARSEFSNRRFELCLFWTRCTGDLKTDLRDDLKIHTGLYS